MDVYTELRIEGTNARGEAICFHAKWFDSLRVQRRRVFKKSKELKDWKIIIRFFNPRLKSFDMPDVVMAQSQTDTPGTMARLFREGKLGSAPPLASTLASKTTDSEVTP